MGDRGSLCQFISIFSVKEELDHSLRERTTEGRESLNRGLRLLLVKEKEESSGNK